MLLASWRAGGPFPGRAGPASRPPGHHRELCSWGQTRRRSTAAAGGSGNYWYEGRSGSEAGTSVEAQSTEPNLKRGLDPVLVFDQPSVQAVLELLLSHPAVGANWSKAIDVAFSRAFFLLAKQPDGDPADRAAALELVRLGWESLEELNGNALVTWLRLVTELGASPEPEWQRAWVWAFESRNAVRELFPAARVQLLTTASLSLTPAGKIWVPRRIVGHNYDLLCAPQRLARLTLRELARMYRAARALRLRPSHRAHAEAAAAAAARLGRGDFDPVSVTQLLAAWGDMEREWEACGRPRPLPLPGDVAQPGSAGAGEASGPVLSYDSEGPGEGEQQQRSSSGVPLFREQRAFPPAYRRPPISGFPGDGVMREVFAALHSNRNTVGAWGLGQSVGALTAMRWLPPRGLLEDLLAALEPQLVGAQHAREVTAVGIALSKLDFDPGEGFARACLRVAEDDGGHDQLLLTCVMQLLAQHQRCVPGQWSILVGLLRQHHARSGGDTGRLNVLMAYQFMLERYGSTAAKAEAGDGPVEPLPLDYLAWALQEAVAAVPRPPSLLSWQHMLVAEEMLGLLDYTYAVAEYFTIAEPYTGAPLQFEIAAPQLRFALMLPKPDDVVHNTGALIFVHAARVRLAQRAGWEVAVLPPGLLPPGRSHTEQQQAVRDFLANQTGLLKRLEAVAAGSALPA